MFARIVSNPAVLGGKPIVKRTRISVEMVREWIALGANRDDIESAPSFNQEDVRQAIG